MSASNLLTLDYLLQFGGFTKVDTCPVGVNRWEYAKTCNYYISITFDDNGYAKYGFFHRNNILNEIVWKYHFDENDPKLTVDQFNTLWKNATGKVR